MVDIFIFPCGSTIIFKNLYIFEVIIFLGLKFTLLYFLCKVKLSSDTVSSE